MPRHGPQRTQTKRQTRRQRHEHACLCTPDGPLLHAVERIAWAIALTDYGGDVASAATCGLTDILTGTKALWCRSAAEAWATYRRWHTQRARP
jgi:hypothetical protein